VVGLTGFIPRPEGPEIEPVIVARSHRGRGIGRMLVEHVVATLRTAGEDTISVRAVGRNAEALAFYHEMGFRIVAYVELMQDLREGSRPWRPGDPLEGRTFLV
jgi:ribosomal protein S18 acetylase RimI-like enzyme